MQKTSNREYILHHLVVGPLETNCYIFGSARTKEVLIIDPGADYDKIRTLIEKEALVAKFIVNTHGHIDHTGANYAFKLPVYIHKRDANFLTNPMLSLSALYSNFAVSPKASRLLEEGDEIDISGMKLKVLHTPGHTPGGISLHYKKIVFTGDALFAGSVGRADLPYSNHKALITAINDKLMRLDDDTLVLPGHGEETTIAAERKSNPWL
ncbi:MAG: MBL fold metallo-hydrolase [Candidatus Omnitrophica bacterium]|nr:MBL fold metallo-hydrolase [Candidatus Omnitrophota bacterium]